MGKTDLERMPAIVNVFDHLSRLDVRPDQWSIELLVKRREHVAVARLQLALAKSSTKATRTTGMTSRPALPHCVSFGQHRLPGAPEPNWQYRKRVSPSRIMSRRCHQANTSLYERSISELCVRAALSSMTDHVVSMNAAPKDTARR